MYLFDRIARKSHFSSIRGLRSTECSSEMLQNLPYFFDKETLSPNYGKFSYTLNIANYLVFHLNILLSANLLFTVFSSLRPAGPISKFILTSGYY